MDIGIKVLAWGYKPWHMPQYQPRTSSERVWLSSSLGSRLYHNTYMYKFVHILYIHYDLIHSSNFLGLASISRPSPSCERWPLKRSKVTVQSLAGGGRRPGSRGYLGSQCSLRHDLSVHDRPCAFYLPQWTFWQSSVQWVWTLSYWIAFIFMQMAPIIIGNILWRGKVYL